MRWLLLSLALVTQAQACSVPVFRYALENWAPSPHEAVVFHDQPLSDVQKKQLLTLTTGRNVTVRPVDINRMMSADDDALLAGRGKARFPWVNLRYPDSETPDRPAWVGSLIDLPALGESPARRHIAERLCKGDSIFWVLLASGDSAADDAAEKLLRSELERLKKELKLPEVDAADLRTNLPLRLSFAILRLERNEEEETLIHELLHSDKEFLTAKGPIVFPIVGRGRMWCGIHGKGLTAKTIADETAALCASCSCLVKEENPGVDLLIRADWQEMLDLGPDEPSKPVPTPPIPPGRREEVAAPSGSSWLLPIGVLVFVGALLALAIPAWRRGGATVD